MLDFSQVAQCVLIDPALEVVEARDTRRTGDTNRNGVRERGAVGRRRDHVVERARFDLRDELLSRSKD